MAIKAEITENDTRLYSYPFLGIDETRNIVLFYRSGCGTIISSPETDSIGGYVDNWVMTAFRVFKDKIELWNV